MVDRNLKKDFTIQLRLPKDCADALRAAMAEMGLDLPNWHRLLLMDLVRIAKEKERPAMPARVMTLKEQEILSRVQTFKCLNFP